MTFRLRSHPGVLFNRDPSVLAALLARVLQPEFVMFMVGGLVAGFGAVLASAPPG